jgi:Ca-activated chloride channel family protein
MRVIAAFVLLGGVTWLGFWFTPDQQGERLMQRGHFPEAAEAFGDPMRQGVAWFRAGEFEKAEQAFARLTSAEADFNRGNCLVMQGKYEQAVERYDCALAVRPDWTDAQTNRAVAVARGAAVARQGGDMGDQQIGADDITFDRKENTGGEETEVEESQPLSDAAMQALWLRRVQTKPADFLKAKFAYQVAVGEVSGGEP